MQGENGQVARKGTLLNNDSEVAMLLPDLLSSVPVH